MTSILRVDHIVINPDHNPRKGDLEGIAELAASIQANGLLQPILVRLLPHPPETYEVVAGHRRLAAIQSLGWGAVECLVTEAENTHELALTENVMRQAMHPVDEYRAFAKLLVEGLKPKQIAKRFGLTEKGVRQRLALGVMIPELRELWRQDKVSDGAAKRIACASEQQQREIFEKFKDRTGIDEYMVNSHLRQDRLHPDSTKVKFVGLGTYKEAGGKIGQDLFGDEKWIADLDLLQDLYDRKVDAICTQLESEGYRSLHWHDDEARPSHDTHDRLYNDGTFEPEERASIDVVIAVGYDGDTTLTFWKDKAPEVLAAPKEKAGASMMAEPDLSKSLSEDMSRVMTGFAHAYAQQPGNHHTVLAMLAYVLTHPGRNHPMHVRAAIYTPTPSDQAILAGSWPDFSENDITLEGLLDTDESDLVHIIVQAAAKTFDLTDKTSGYDGVETRAPWYKLLAQSGDATPAWKPTAETYFKRLNAKQIRAAMRDMRGDELTQGFAEAKKGELAIVAERWAAETGWLPELLAPRLYGDAENPPGGGEVNPSIEGDDPDPEDRTIPGDLEDREPEPTVKEHIAKVIKRGRKSVAERLAAITVEAAE